MVFVCFHCYVTTKNFKTMVTWNELSPCQAYPDFIQIMVFNMYDFENVNSDLEFTCFLNFIKHCSFTKFQFLSCSSLHCSSEKLNLVYVVVSWILGTRIKIPYVLVTVTSTVLVASVFLSSYTVLCTYFAGVLQLSYKLRPSLTYWAQIPPISKL